MMIRVPRFGRIPFDFEILCPYGRIVPEMVNPGLSHSFTPLRVSLIIDVRILGFMEELFGLIAIILHLTTKIHHETSSLSDHFILHVRKP